MFAQFDYPKITCCLFVSPLNVPHIFPSFLSHSISILTPLWFRLSCQGWINTIFHSLSVVCGVWFCVWSCAWVCIKALLFLTMFEGACPCAKSLARNARPAPFHCSTPNPPFGPRLSHLGQAASLMQPAHTAFFLLYLKHISSYVFSVPFLVRKAYIVLQ